MTTVFQHVLRVKVYVDLCSHHSYLLDYILAKWKWSLCNVLNWIQFHVDCVMIESIAAA